MFLEANPAVETVRQAFDGTSDQPRPEWIRGNCPHCECKGMVTPVVSNCYYIGGRGYLIVWECWLSLLDMEKDYEDRRCNYRKVL